MSTVTDVTGASFTAEVLEAEGPVIVDFWAPWCGPCRQVAPALDQLAEAHPNVKIVKVNVDEEMDLAMKYQITGIPAIKLFHEGEQRAEVLGARSRAGFEKEFADYLN